jgi:hypothetical protein
MPTAKPNRWKTLDGQTGALSVASLSTGPASPGATGTMGQPNRQPAPTDDGLQLRTDDEDEGGIPGRAAEHAVRAAPPWLISAVLHMVLLIVLALVGVANEEKHQLELLAGNAEKLGDQLEVDVLQPTGNAQTPEAVAPVVLDLPAVDDPIVGGPKIDLPSVLAATSPTTAGTGGELSVPSIGLALTGREKGAKRALLAAYGGTGTTEAAVQLGVEWLARQQERRSGLWSLAGPYANGTGQENRVAATSMALLAFQGAGETHREGKHQQVVTRGIDGLLKLQDNEGNFFREGVSNHRLYSQAMATIAACELYGMTKDERFRKPAQKALDYAAKIQTANLGGWRYAPRMDSDTSVTGWFVMALQSGLMAGLEVPSPTLDAVSKYLDSVTKDGSTYGYQPGREPTVPMTAEALLARQYLGWKHDDPRLRAGVDVLLQNLIDYDAQNVYYWYYATQVLHHMGGADWEKWNKAMRERVPEQQVKEGVEAGSWAPHADRWGAHGGRLYTTCLSIFMLEVYYRHLPIYK